MSSIVDSDSVLAVDLGTVSTRVMLFDAVGDRYRFLGSSKTPTTAEAPLYDCREGILRAIRQLQEITGRTFLDSHGNIILPGMPSGEGVDRLLITYSNGPELRFVTLGLLEDISVESANRLVSSTYGRLVESIGLNDQRPDSAKVDAILNARPNLVLICGGTDQGAVQSLARMVNLVATACQLFPPKSKPVVMYAGNASLEKTIQDGLRNIADVWTAPNVLPAMGTEDLRPAQHRLFQAVNALRLQQIRGLREIGVVASDSPIQHPQAIHRMVGFLSQVYSPDKGVLFADVGARSTVLAAGQGKAVEMRVFPTGLGQGLQDAIRLIELERILRWMPVPVSEEEVTQYLVQKSLHPASLPGDDTGLAIEHALTRLILQYALAQQSARPIFNKGFFEPILAAGAVFSMAPSPQQALLMLLDGLQPKGVTTLVMDQYGVLPALGAVASVNPLLPIHVMETSAFVNLGIVLSPICEARYGTPILRAHVEYESGSTDEVEITQGSITSIPLAYGATANLFLEPLRRLQLDPHFNSAEGIRVAGGTCGMVIDARGRPVSLPSGESQRRDLMKRWLVAIGG